jgi:hypothetical protein
MTMHSSRVLGAVALAAIVVAAISFAIVDVSISDGCGGSPCASGLPVTAITFAVLGALALLVSALPAVSWIVEAIQAARHSDADADRELARQAREARIQRTSVSDVDEEL